MSQLFITPAVLKEKEAWAYVGGRPVWDDLLKHYQKHLVPLRESPTRGDAVYRRETIDKVIQLAEIEGKLRNPSPIKPKLPSAKIGRIPTTPPTDCDATE